MKVEADVSTVYVISPSVSCIVRNEECNGSCAFLDGVADEGPDWSVEKGPELPAEV